MPVIKYRVDKNSPWNSLVAIKGEPGEPGKDGYTPIKGVDYFDGKDGAPGEAGADGNDYVLTTADKTEIANLVLASLPSGEEVSY